jgi:flagellar basal body-associated protein FliL
MYAQQTAKLVSWCKDLLRGFPRAEVSGDKAGSPKDVTMNFVMLGATGLVAAVAGFLVPRFIAAPAATGRPQEEQSEQQATSSKLGFVPFDGVLVNLNEERLTRSLRLKFTMVVERAQEKLVADLIQKRKPELKNWLLSYLADKGIADVTGAAAQNRVRREIQDQFNAFLFPDGSEKIHDVFFEQWNVQ